MKANSILVVGDSLSAAYGIEIESGWVNLLQNRLKAIPELANWHIINASVSGETTSGALARLPDLLESYHPKLCIVELGANDGLRGQSIEQMQQNLDKIIRACKQYGDVLLLGMRLPPNYGKKYKQAFDQTYALLAEKNNVPLVPFILEGIALDEELFQGDGLHPTKDAQEVILGNVWPVLDDVLVTQQE